MLYLIVLKEEPNLDCVPVFETPKNWHLGILPVNHRVIQLVFMKSLHL